MSATAASRTRMVEVGGLEGRARQACALLARELDELDEDHRDIPAVFTASGDGVRHLEEVFAYKANVMHAPAKRVHDSGWDLVLSVGQQAIPARDGLCGSYLERVRQCSGGETTVGS